MFARFKYHLLMHLIIFIWGFTGILGRLIDLKPIPIVWYRVLIAFVALLLIVPFLKSSFKPSSPKRLLQMMGVGVLVGLHWVTFYQAIQLSTASLGILCLATTTFHVAWLEPIIMRRKFSRLEFLLSLFVVAGIYFIAGDFDAKQYEALLYGLLSALLAAGFSVFNAKIAEDTSPVQITLYEMIAAFIFLTVVLLFQGEINADLFRMRMSDALWLLFLGILCTSFAFLATIAIVKKLGAFTVSLSINMEPVYTILLAIVILNENEVLSEKFYIGSVVIVLVVIANAILKYFSVKRT